MGVRHAPWAAARCSRLPQAEPVRRGGSVAPGQALPYRRPTGLPGGHGAVGLGGCEGLGTRVQPANPPTCSGLRVSCRCRRRAARR